MNIFNQFFFDIYPYIRLAVSFLGSLVRFNHEQYTWKNGSSKLLHRGQLCLDSVLFHVGALAVFFGHLFGLLTLLWFWKFISVSHQTKQITAMTAGGISGSAVLAGLIILIRRRFKIERTSVNSIWHGKPVLVWLLITLLLGLSTILVSMGYLDGEEMAGLMQWTQHIVTFRSGVASYPENVNSLFKMYVFMGMTLSFIFPPTRMVHVRSGFTSIFYISRAWQLVCRR